MPSRLLPCLPTISATCSELGTGTRSVMLAPFLDVINVGVGSTLPSSSMQPETTAPPGCGTPPATAQASTITSWSPPTNVVPPPVRISRLLVCLSVPTSKWPLSWVRRRRDANKALNNRQLPQQRRPHTVAWCFTCGSGGSGSGVVWERRRAARGVHTVSRRAAQRFTDDSSRPSDKRPPGQSPTWTEPRSHSTSSSGHSLPFTCVLHWKWIRH